MKTTSMVSIITMMNTIIIMSTVSIMSIMKIMNTVNIMNIVSTVNIINIAVMSVNIVVVKRGSASELVANAPGMNLYQR